MPAAWAAAAAAVVGAVVQSNSAKKASKAQQESAREANEVNKSVADQQTALQREMFEKTNALQQPALNDGATARNELMHYLGLTSQNDKVAAPANLTREQIRAQLAPQFTQSSYASGGGQEMYRQGDTLASRYGGPQQMMRGPYQAGAVDDAGLNSAIDARMAQQTQAMTAYQRDQAARANDPTFGAGSRNFGMSDFQQDPGYAFRMAEGQKALERSAAARGGLMSGSAAKDSMRFSQDLGSQEYMAAFNRFQTNRANKLNPLQSLMGAGQTAAGTIGTAGQNMANSSQNALGQYSNNAQSNLIGAGNARASGYLAQGQAWANAANQIGGAFSGGGGGGNKGWP